MSIDPRRIEAMDETMAEIIRSKAPAERLVIANGMWRSARDIIIGMLRHQHPDWSDTQVRRETARRLSHGAA